MERTFTETPGQVIITAHLLFLITCQKLLFIVCVGRGVHYYHWKSPLDRLEVLKKATLPQKLFFSDFSCICRPRSRLTVLSVLVMPPDINSNKSRHSFKPTMKLIKHISAKLWLSLDSDLYFKLQYVQSPFYKYFKQELKKILPSPHGG